LALVEAGESFEITSHGRPVALLAPLPVGRESQVRRLRAQGRLIDPRGDISRFVREHPPVMPDGAVDASSARPRGC
jgi:antitoxin (DNA-binding transcriptional repressor) of toxin-antitoxin stability system